MTGRSASRLIALALALSGLSACSSDGDGVTADIDPSQVTTVRLDGVTVTIPAGAADGGTLRIQSATVKDLPDYVTARGKAVDVSIEGGKLTGDARISFSVPSGGPGEGRLPVGFGESGNEVKALPAAGGASSGNLEVTATELGSVFLGRIDTARWADGQARQFEALASGRLDVDTPTCGRAVPGDMVRVTADQGDSVRWCLGESGSGLLLKVTNGRKTFAAMQYPIGWGAPKQANGIFSGVAVDRFWATQATEAARRKGRSLAVVASGATLEIALPAEPSGTVSVTLGPTALMTTLARFGVSAYADAAAIAGQPMSNGTWEWVGPAVAGRGDPAIRPAARACRLALAPLVGTALDAEHTLAVTKAVMGCVPGLLSGVDPTQVDAAQETARARAQTMYDDVVAAVVAGVTGAGGTWDKAARFAADRSFDVEILASRLDLSDLRSASIPASCGHAATRLSNGSAHWGMEGDAALILSGDGTVPVLTDITGDGRRDAVVVMDCNAGGVGWPQWLLLYGPGPKLLGAIDMGKQAPSAEHASVSRLRVIGRTIAVDWSTYEGAGFGTRLWHGTASWSGGAWRLTGATEDKAAARCGVNLEEAVNANWPQYDVEVFRCDGRWAYLGDAQGMGDTEQMWRYEGHWYLLSSLPTTYCKADVRKLGAPEWFVDHFYDGPCDE